MIWLSWSLKGWNQGVSPSFWQTLVSFLLEIQQKPSQWQICQESLSLQHDALFFQGQVGKALRSFSVFSDSVSLIQLIFLFMNSIHSFGALINCTKVFLSWSWMWKSSFQWSCSHWTHILQIEDFLLKYFTDIKLYLLESQNATKQRTQIMNFSVQLKLNLSNDYAIL